MFKNSKKLVIFPYFYTLTPENFIFDAFLSIFPSLSFTFISFTIFFLLLLLLCNLSWNFFFHSFLYLVFTPEIFKNIFYLSLTTKDLVRCSYFLHSCLPAFSRWRIVLHYFYPKQLLRISVFDGVCLQNSYLFILWIYNC